MSEKNIEKKLEELVRRSFPEIGFNVDSVSNKVSEIREWVYHNECQLLDISDARLSLLREIPDPPPLLFIRGNVDVLINSALTVVGTRCPSPYGVRAAWKFSSALAERGYAIVSGLARGVDSAAHQASLKVKGITIAVLAHGLDTIYPKENSVLARDILAGKGLLISEFLPGIPPRKHHFPQRNRILSGLSLGTLVIEAARKSGSLITATFALNQNREVFSVPSAFDDRGFEGNHSLIQQGAKLVMGVEDIISEIPCGESGQRSRAARTTKLFSLEQLFQACAGSASLEELFVKSSWGLGELLEMLEEGEHSGFLAEISSQRFVWLGNSQT